MSTSGLTSYDKVLYPSYTRIQTHPDRLATIGTLLGMDPPPVQRCRVLELGCGNGSNLAPIAYGLPESEFVGVDLAAIPIANAKKMVEDLGLKNISFQNCSISDVSPALGQFDYIVCHGVFSWVPAEVRESILRICREQLSPRGVAFVSYNAYPGNRLREMIREMMLFHVQGFSEPEEKIEQARALAGFVAAAQDETDTYRKFLKEEMERFMVQDGNYFFHDALAEINNPLYFFEFMEAAHRHDLQYLGEADFHDMLDKAFPAGVTKKLNELSGNRIAREQYLDFLRCRRFRQTLLCHQNVPLNLALKPEVLSKLFVAAVARPLSKEPAITARVVEKFESPKGAAIQTDCPLTKMALLILSDYWPEALPFERLLTLVREKLAATGKWESSDAAAEELELRKTLLKGYAAGLIELHTYSPPYARRVGERPKASPLARWQVEHCGFVTTLFHATIRVDDNLARELLLLSDGTRDRGALQERLEGLLKEQPAPEGKTQPDAGQTRQLLSKALDQNLEKMARMGLLVE